MKSSFAFICLLSLPLLGCLGCQSSQSLQQQLPSEFQEVPLENSAEEYLQSAFGDIAGEYQYNSALNKIYHANHYQFAARTKHEGKRSTITIEIGLDSQQWPEQLFFAVFQVNPKKRRQNLVGQLKAEEPVLLIRADKAKARRQEFVESGLTMSKYFYTVEIPDSKLQYETSYYGTPYQQFEFIISSLTNLEGTYERRLCRSSTIVSN